MLVDTYKSEIDGKKFLSVPAGSDISKLSISELDPDYGKLALSQSGVDVDPTASANGLVNAAILRDIAEHGFAVHLAPS